MNWVAKKQALEVYTAAGGSRVSDLGGCRIPESKPAKGRELFPFFSVVGGSTSSFLSLGECKAPEIDWVCETFP